jgi:hypothetical protein
MTTVQIGVRLFLSSKDEKVIRKIEKSVSGNKKSALENQMRLKLLSYWGFEAPVDMRVEFDSRRCPDSDLNLIVAGEQ